jgi:protein SDA1
MYRVEFANHLEVF